MSTEIAFIPNEDRLDISFEGNLDVSVWHDVYDACARTSPALKTCIVDLTRVERVFDSGIAILALLCARMHEFGAVVVFVSDDLNIKARVGSIASPHWHQTPATA